MGVRDGLVRPADRVLIVDDWAATGAQARALRSLFPGSHGTSLSGASLSDASLSDASLSDASLSGASLSDTSLSGTYVGTAVIVDDCPPEVSAELGIRGLLTGQDLM